MTVSLELFYLRKGESEVSRNWVMVLIASLFEVGWVIGLKHASSGWAWLGTAVAIAISFYVMMAASKHLPVGTVYSVFVGLGTAGTICAELLFFHDEFKLVKLVLLLVLLSGVVGLKMVSQENEEKGAES